MSPFRWRTLFAVLLVTALLIALWVPEQAVGAPAKERRRWRALGTTSFAHSQCPFSYSLRKGTRLERHHRRSLHDWRRAASPRRQHGKRHRHRKHALHIHKVQLEEILRQMDSLVKPRFG